MRLWRGFAIVLVVAAAASAGPDPWDVPGPRGAELLLVLQNSPRPYALVPSKATPKDANGPETVDLALAADERTALEAARTLVAKSDFDGAVKACDEILAKNPSDWHAHLTRAQALHAAGKDADALPSLRESLIGNRRNPASWDLLQHVAEALGKKAVRPAFALQAWVREKPNDEIEVGSLYVVEADYVWTYYACARAVYRYEGAFARDFPALKPYAFTFREQMYALETLADAAEDQRKDGKRNSADLQRLLAERKAGTLAPFAWFAVYPEPLGRPAEAHLDELKPALAKYFDEKIVPPK